MECGSKDVPANSPQRESNKAIFCFRIGATTQKINQIESKWVALPPDQIAGHLLELAVLHRSRRLLGPANCQPHMDRSSNLHGLCSARGSAMQPAMCSMQAGAQTSNVCHVCHDAFGVCNVNTLH
eukprot:365743-Chlamydomonas_euryale.AAC.11